MARLGIAEALRREAWLRCSRAPTGSAEAQVSWDRQGQSGEMQRLCFGLRRDGRELLHLIGMATALNGENGAASAKHSFPGRRLSTEKHSGRAEAQT